LGTAVKKSEPPTEQSAVSLAGGKHSVKKGWGEGEKKDAVQAVWGCLKRGRLAEKGVMDGGTWNSNRNRKVGGGGMGKS